MPYKLSRRWSVKSGPIGEGKEVAAQPCQCKMSGTVTADRSAHIPRKKTTMALQPRRALAYQATAAQPEGLQITRCRVVSTTNPLGRYSWLSRPGPLSHRQIAPQLFSRRLSGPRTSPQIQVKIPDLAGNRTRGLQVRGRHATPTQRG